MAYGVVQSCSACGQQNRVPVSRIGQNPVCGACKASLGAPGKPIDVSDADLAALLAESPVPVVVDFWAPWCGPCRMVAPALANIAGSMSGKVLVAKVNVDDNPRAAQQYQARSIPLLVGFHQGKPVDRQVGAAPAPELRAWVEQVVARSTN
jgi:thioredoxin 2